MAIGAVAMMLAVGGRAQASVVTYTDRALFEATLSPFTVYNFNSDNALVNTTVDGGHDFGAFTISQPASGTAYIRGPVTATDGIVDGTLFVQYNENSSGSVPLLVEFDSPIRAFGFNFNNVDTNGDFDVYLNILGTDYEVAASGTHGFFGAISNDALMTQALFSFTDFPLAGSGTIGLDNFTWGTPSAANATPLPGALPLFGSGLVALGLIARRCKKRAAA